MNPDLKLRDYQVEDLAQHIKNPKHILQHDPGTGKTPIVCALAWYWWSRKGKRTIWSMPKSLMHKNREEMLAWTEFSEEDVVILEKGTTPFGDAKVLICTFAWLRTHHERLLRDIPDLGFFAVDESHMGYSTHTSKQTQSMYRVARRCEGFAPMTGSLIRGRLDSAYPVIAAIEPRYYGSYEGFVDQHAGFIDDYGKVQWWINEDKLRAILDKHSTRRTVKEVFGPDPVHFETRRLQMAAKQREKYEEFHELAMLELEDGRVLDGSLPGVAIIRARQIMQHPETMGIKGEPAKDQAILEYAAEGRPMLVFSVLQPEQERLVRKLNSEGYKAGLINADVTGKDRAKVDEDFRGGRLDVIVASPATAAVGFNWHRADLVVNASLGYMDDEFVQGFRRAIRGTRDTPLRVVTLAYQDSVDERIMAILTEKSLLANKIDESRQVLEFA